MFHLFIILLIILCSKLNNSSMCYQCIACIKWVIFKIFAIFTFGYYIRYILETNQYVLVSSFNEIYYFNTSQLLMLISSCFSLIVFILCLVLIVFSAFLSFSDYQIVEGKHNKLGEFFNGIKMQRKCKIYLCILLIRRAAFVILLLSLNKISSQTLCGILTAIQLSYIIFLLIIRPYEEAKGNLIEIVNEFFYLILLGSLIFLNTKSDWSPTIINVYIWILTTNSIINFSIVIGDIIIKVIIKIKTKCTGTTGQETRITPLPLTQVTQVSVIKKRDDGRNDKYLVEESKIALEDISSNVRFAR